VTDTQSGRPRIKRPPGFVIDLPGAFIRGVKVASGNLEGANLAEADARDVVMHDARLTNALLRNINLTGADLERADARGADLAGALLRGTNLKGADLRGARGLIVEQLAEAVIDETTRLPDYISREDLQRAKGAV